MNRRTVLGTLGVTGIIPLLGYTTNRGGSTVSVRFWQTPGAAAHDGVEQRIRRLLTQCLDFDHWTIEVTSGGVVDIGTENAADAVTGGAWPRTLLGGVAGVRAVEPAWDVNLLVTDGPLTVAPSGYGIPHVAAVGGAGTIAALDLTPSLSEPIPVTPETFAAQLVLHEVGHALGLSHKDGRRYSRRGLSIVTPMLSLYGWRRQELVRSMCQPFSADPTVPPASSRRLDFSFSQCARRSLREYDGDHIR